MERQETSGALAELIKLFKSGFESAEFASGIALAKGCDAYDWLQVRGIAELRHLRRVLIAVLAVPTAIAFIGLLLGFVGYHAGYINTYVFSLLNISGQWMIWDSLINNGQWMVMIAAVGFLAGGFYIWARIAFISELLVIASYAFSKLPIPIFRAPKTWFVLNRESPEIVREGLLPKIDWTSPDVVLRQETVQKYLRQLMGILFWGSFTAAYAVVFPVYANLTWFLLALVAGAGLYMGAYHFIVDTPWAKRVSLGFLILTFLAVTFSFSTVLLRDQKSASQLRMQRIMAMEYAEVSQEREALYAKYGVKIEEPVQRGKSHQTKQLNRARLAYQDKSKQLEAIELKMVPVSPPELKRWIGIKLREASSWTSQQMTIVFPKTEELSLAKAPPLSSSDDEEEDEDDSEEEDPSTEGTPLEDDSSELEEEPEPVPTPASDPQVASPDPSAKQAAKDLLADLEDLDQEDAELAAMKKAANL